METHSSILAWETPRTWESGGVKSMVSQRAGHDLATEHIYHLAHDLMCRRKLAFKSKSCHPHFFFFFFKDGRLCETQIQCSQAELSENLPFMETLK